MSLKGNLTSIHLADIIQLIGLGEKTGCLQISGGNDKAYMYFNKGIITYGYSDNNTVTLEKMNAEKSFVDQAKLKSVLSAAKDKDRNPIELLVRGGLTTEEKFKASLKSYMLGVMYDIFKWTEGEFEFIPDKMPEAPLGLVAESFSNLIMEGSRRIDEIDVIKKIFTSDKTSFHVTADGANKLASLPMNEAEKNLLKNMNTITNIYQLSKHSQLEEFELYKIVYGLHQSKVIEVMPRQAEDIVKEHIDLATFYIERENYEDAAREATRAFSLVPTDQNIISLLKICSDYTELNQRINPLFKAAKIFSAFTDYSLVVKTFVSERAEMKVVEQEKKEKKLSPKEVLIKASHLAKKGDFKGVVDTLTAFGEIKHSTYYLLLGNAYFKLSKMKEAYEVFSKSYELNPENEKIKKLLMVIKTKI